MAPTAPKAPATTTSETRATGVAVGIQLALGVTWLVATVWVAHASIIANADDADVALGSAAAALPGVVAATLFAGACAGLGVGWRVPTRPPLRAWSGAAGGALVGAFVGALVAGAILYGYGANSSVALLATTVGVAGALGGAAASLPNKVLAAGLAATSWVLLAGLILGALQGRVSSLVVGADVGADAAVAAQASSSIMLAYAQSALAGALAGIMAYRSLRRDQRPWPWFLAAGALPGVLLLVAELLTRVGGSSLQSIVKGFSPFDQALVEFTNFARFRHGLVVLFVGAITSMIAVGRTLGRPDSSAE